MVTSQQTTFVVFPPVPAIPEREQPLNRLREAGAYGVSAAELLSLVLRQPDLDTAHRLLRQFPTLGALAHATETELTALPGVGPSGAAALRAALELGRRVEQERAPQAVSIQNPGDAAAILLPFIGNQEHEHFAVLYLNTRNHVTAKEILYKGSLNTSLVRVGEVFKGAIRRNCAGVLVSHNHPSGDPSPSPEDIALTRRLVVAGQLLELDVVDHIIVARGRYTSLREQQLGFEEA
jgi:DNA repair protein RadC